ncbi:MAG: Coenzyme F420 hydrogenase subunit beta [Methanocella sp. PtaU1.Bin125]|nr:MAG: Coenzyme F420 hydrogenase subunit beta [Methanocella sp. PtaU1.Bin125]
MGGYQGFGKYRGIVSARAADESIRSVAQDGGTVTALLCFALETGDIDGAVLTRKADERWTPGQLVATTEREIRESAGSVYALSPSVFQLKEAAREMALEKIAYVGLPCQVVAVRKMQLYPFGGRYVGDKVRYVIGIFCSENFPPESLRNIVEGYAGTPIEKMRKMYLAKGKFNVASDGEIRQVSVKKASHWAQDGDHVCPDLVAEYADISVGSIGSEPGWNTVFLRTRRGEDLFNRARDQGRIETKDMETVQPGLKTLEKLAVAKKANAKEAIAKREQMGLYVTRDMYY